MNAAEWIVDSVNDVAVHPKSKAIFFTDPSTSLVTSVGEAHLMSCAAYGFTQDFRSEQYVRRCSYLVEIRC